MAGVAAAVQNGLMGIGLQKLSFGVRMTGVAYPIQSLLDNPLHIRAMRIMARIAFLFGKRSMGNLGFPGFFCLSMTAEAQLAGLCIQKILVLRRMGPMAGKTSLFTRHGGMLEGDVLSLLFMAVKTELVQLFRLKLWALGGMGVVACQTLPFLKGAVFHAAARLKL